MMKIEEGCQRSCILEDLKAGSYVTSPKYLEYHKSSCYTESGLCHEKSACTLHTRACTLHTR